MTVRCHICGSWEAESSPCERCAWQAEQLQLTPAELGAMQRAYSRNPNPNADYDPFLDRAIEVGLLPPHKAVRPTRGKRAEVKALHAQGVKPSDIAAKLGLTIRTTYNYAYTE